MNNPETDPEKQALIDLVQLHARQLGEHVDTVQIFVTKELEGRQTSRSYQFGTGSLHARIGLIHEWMIIQEEYAREYARQQQREELE